MEDNKNIKYNLYRLKSIIIQNKYNKNMKKYEKDNNIIKKLKVSIDNLKEINLIYMYADIESLKNGSTKYPDNLIYNEMLNRNNFFAILLGFIDGNIEYIKKYESNLEHLSLFNLVREEIVYDYDKNITICDSKKIIDFVHTKNIEFKTFLEDINNNYDLINLHFISNYLIGFYNFKKFNLLEVYSLYKDLLKELYNYKEINRTKTEKLRLKKLSF